MKIKNMNQKLTFKKSTIANLEEKDLSAAKGGAWSYTCYGATCNVYKCPDTLNHEECITVTMDPSCISC